MLQWSVDALRARARRSSEIVVALPARASTRLPAGRRPSASTGGATRSESVRAAPARGRAGRRSGARPRRRAAAGDGGAGRGGARRARRRAGVDGADRGRARDRHDQASADDGRRRRARRSSAPACGPSRRRRSSAARRWSGRSTCPRRCSRRPPTRPGWWSAPAGAVAVVPGPRENLKVTTPLDLLARRARLLAARRAASAPGLIESRCTMLTDYHVHLRSDDLDGDRRRALHGRATSSATARPPASAGSPSWGSPSTSTASARRWRSGTTRSGARTPSTTWMTTAGSCASETDLRLGIEADFVAGREDRIANLLDVHDFDYVIGSVHFLARQAPSTWTSTACGAAAAAPRGSGGATSRRSARRRAAASSTSSPTPTWSRSWAPSGRRPEGDPRRYYELALEGIAESGVAVEVSTAGLRKPRRARSTRAGLPAEMCLEAGAPVALSSDAHRPEDIGADYERRSSCLGAPWRGRAVRLRAPRAPSLEPIGPRACRTFVGIGYDSHRLVAGRELVVGGRAVRAERGLAGHSDADVLTHAVIDALLGAAGLGRHRPALPRQRRALRAAPTRSALLGRWSRELARGAASQSVQRRLHGGDGAPEAGAASRARCATRLARALWRSRWRA